MLIDFTLVVLGVIAAVSCDVNVDSLFHGAVPPQVQPQPAAAPPVQADATTQAPDPSIPNLDIFENYMPYASSRHDEFDWALTKVNNSLFTFDFRSMFKYFINYFRIYCIRKKTTQFFHHFL